MRKFTPVNFSFPVKLTRRNRPRTLWHDDDDDDDGHDERCSLSSWQWANLAQALCDCPKFESIVECSRFGRVRKRVNLWPIDPLSGEVKALMGCGEKGPEMRSLVLVAAGHWDWLNQPTKSSATERDSITTSRIGITLVNYDKSSESGELFFVLQVRGQIFARAKSLFVWWGNSTPILFSLFSSLLLSTKLRGPMRLAS